MLAGEQQELHQIEQGLRDTDRWFAWQLTLLQGLPRRAGSGRRAYLLALTVLAAALLRLVAGTGRLLRVLAEGAIVMEPTVLMVLRDTAWAGWESGQEPRHHASPGPSAVGWHGPVMTTQGSTDGWVRAYRLAALGEDEPVHVGHRPVPGTPAPHWRPPSSRRKYGPDMSTSQCWALVAGQRRDLADARPAGARS